MSVVIASRSEFDRMDNIDDLPTAPGDDELDGDEPEDVTDVDGNDPAPAQQLPRRQRRLESNVKQWRTRAAEAEAELASMRAECDVLRAQAGSVAALRTSLLQTAIRAHAATMVVPEAIDDVVRLLEAGDLTVSDDGTIDDVELKTKVDELVKARPYLMPRAGLPRPLPGGHRPPPKGRAHGEFNDWVRRAARGDPY